MIFPYKIIKQEELHDEVLKSSQGTVIVLSETVSIVVMRKEKEKEDVVPPILDVSLKGLRERNTKEKKRGRKPGFKMKKTENTDLLENTRNAGILAKEDDTTYKQPLNAFKERNEERITKENIYTCDWDNCPNPRAVYRKDNMRSLIVGEHIFLFCCKACEKSYKLKYAIT